ncbi:MAG: hypothetical protein H7X80_00350 [bacterium]|nr:hypothetical protein [Candidatus Kapabacteria bacterium]
MDFELLSAISEVQVIARSRQIRELNRLVRSYGQGNWRKMKGFALVRFLTSTAVTRQEVHWYEAHGIGKREFKVKFAPR